MKFPVKSAIRATALVLTAALVVPNLAMARQESRDTRAILALAADIERMYENGDASIAQSHYIQGHDRAPVIIDAVDNPWGQAWTRGHADYVRQVQMYAAREGIYAAAPKGYQQDYIEPAVWSNGRMATFVAGLRFSWLDAEGRRISNDKGRYTLVFIKDRGAWKIWHEHFSIALPKPPAMQKLTDEIAAERARAKPAGK